MSDIRINTKDSALTIVLPETAPGRKFIIYCEHQRVDVSNDGKTWILYEGGANLPKCDCGAHAVGSDRHSNWCTLSELENL